MILPLHQFGHGRKDIFMEEERYDVFPFSISNYNYNQSVNWINLIFSKNCATDSILRYMSSPPFECTCGALQPRITAHNRANRGPRLPTQVVWYQRVPSQVRLMKTPTNESEEYETEWYFPIQIVYIRNASEFTGRMFLPKNIIIGFHASSTIKSMQANCVDKQETTKI